MSKYKAYQYIVGVLYYLFIGLIIGVGLYLFINLCMYLFYIAVIIGVTVPYSTIMSYLGAAVALFLAVVVSYIIWNRQHGTEHYRALQ